MFLFDRQLFDFLTSHIHAFSLKTSKQLLSFAIIETLIVLLSFIYFTAEVGQICSCCSRSQMFIVAQLLLLYAVRFLQEYEEACTLLEERACLFMGKHQEGDTFSILSADMQSKAQLILVLGGARSGKSTFAERLAVRSGRSVAYIATATASDDDMRDRILRHRAARPTAWQTIEEPLELDDAILRGALVADVILLDCITLWVSNWLMSQGEVDYDDPSLMTGRHYEGAIARIDALLAVLASLDADKTLIVVSNEVGLGIVPAYALGRLYRDLLGLVNQRLATAAARVYLMVAGLGVDIKRLHEEAVL